MAGLAAIDSEVTGNLLHLWVGFITFMIVQFITYVVGRFITVVIKGYYINCDLSRENIPND